MSLLVMPESASHWYTKAGDPCHKVEMTTRPGEWRNTSLRDARKLGLVPSVTNVLRIIANPGLDAWKQSIAIEAALTHPVPDGDPIDEHIPAIVEEAKSISESAKLLGSKHHNTIESIIPWLNGETDEYLRDDAVPIETCEAFISWYHDYKLESHAIERAFVSPVGYGGRIDFEGAVFGVNTFIDWKTQDTKGKGKIRFYPEWAWQLDAYAHGCGKPEYEIVSVGISTTEPGLIEMKQWDRSKCNYFDVFLAAFNLWKRLKNYDPSEENGDAE